MSGIIPPSILTLQYAVDKGFKKYVNLSFPYRIKIESIWFTADDALSGINDDGPETNPWVLNRTLRLGAVKQRNAKRPTSTGDAPSDLNLVWAPGFNWYGPGTDLTDNDKPSIWFGLPDDREDVADANPETPEQEVSFDTWWDTDVIYRSTARPLPSKNRMSKWHNYGWNEEEFNALAYTTDLSVMGQDEFLSLFVYPDGGDWDSYLNMSGIVTIFVQYTGVGGTPAERPDRIWD